MGVARDMAGSYLVFLCGLTMLVGVSVTALGVYAVLEEQSLASLPWFSVDSTLAAGVSILILGVVVMLISCLGCFGATNNNKCAMGVFNLMVLLLAVLIGAAGILGFVYSGLFDDVAGQQAADIRGELEQEINDGQLALYQKCCFVPFNGNGTVLLPVQPCAASNNLTSLAACSLTTDFYATALEAVTEEVCDVAEKIEINGHPLVGNPATSTGACGAGLPAVFQRDLVDVALAYTRPVSIGSVVLGVVLLLAFVAGMIMMCTSRAAERRRQQESDGIGLSGTAPPPNGYAGNQPPQYAL